MLESIIVAKSDDRGYWLPLWYHAKDTAGIAELLLHNWLPESVIKQLIVGQTENSLLHLVRFLSLVHDIGKITPVFQRKITGKLPLQRANLSAADLFMNDEKEGIQHAAAGESILIEFGVPIRIAAIVGAHHGKPTGSVANPMDNAKDIVRRKLGDSRENNRKCWQSARLEFFTYALDESGYKRVSNIQSISFQQQILLTALIIMADWIASNSDYFPLIRDTDTGSFYDTERVEIAWTKVRLPDRWEPEEPAMNGNDFRKLFGFIPNTIQDTMITVACGMMNPGVIILEAPMGGGKTEAALAASEILASRNGCGGIYFGLPTQATANGLFPRLMRWASLQTDHDRHTIRLAHRLADMNNDYASLPCNASNVSEEGLFVHDWFSGRKKALLADFVVGTVDQLLMAALKQKHVMLRHLGMAGKVVVVDECHSYDAYMNEYLDRTLMWLASYGVPVILLSATLPALRREQIVKAYLSGLGIKDGPCLQEYDTYPLITWTDGNNCSQMPIKWTGKSKSVNVIRIPEEGIIDKLRILVMNGAAVGIICNTVKHAQAVYDVITATFCEQEVMLCHAQFIPADRTEWENTLLERLGKNSTQDVRNGLIVIGSPVLEQSLDIDFDVIITDLCPMDLLLQRIGRLHRHDRVRPEGAEMPICYVLAETDHIEPDAKEIYGEWILRRTMEELPAIIRLPEDISPLVQNVYSEPKDKEQKAYLEYEKENEEKRIRACAFKLGRTDDLDKKCWDKKSLLNGFLDADFISNEEMAYAAVRDSISSIEVLILVREDSEIYHFLPWAETKRKVSAEQVPDPDTVREMRRQRLRLPYVFATPGNLTKTLEYLHRFHSTPTAWVTLPDLRDELFLFLDANGCANIGNYQLCYKKQKGLMIKMVISDGT